MYNFNWLAWQTERIGNLVRQIRKAVNVQADHVYREIGVRSHGKGIFHKDEVTGQEIGSKRVFWVQPDCFVVNIVFAWEQAIAKTTEAEKGMIASHRFPMYMPIKGKLDLDYMLYFFRSTQGKYLLELASPGGAGRNKTLGQEAFLDLEIPCPPIAEQQKIAKILGTWDEAIQLTQELIVAKEHRKKGLMQRLLTGQVRFPGFEKQSGMQKTPFVDIPSDWNYIPIGKVAREIKTNNINGKDLPVLSCTKHNGLVDSLEYFGRQIYSDDTSTYKVVKRGQFAYATNHIEEGSIGYQSLYDEALISPMYIVFQTNERVNDSFLFRVLKTELYRHIFEVSTNGTVNRRGSLRWNQFLQIKIPLPSLEEQKRISEFFDVCDHEIELLQHKLEALQAQKKGLMQRLLTGQVRVLLDDGLEARTPLPELTMLQSMIIHSCDWYKQVNKKPPTRIAVQKMPYIQQHIIGIPLELDHIPHQRGPYSYQLHDLLESMSEVSIVGYGDGSEASEIEPTPDVSKAAKAFFQSNPDLAAAFTRFTEFVKGFESQYGLELLATVHWLLVENPQASENEIVYKVCNWSDWKKDRYKPGYIIKALKHLRAYDMR